MEINNWQKTYLIKLIIKDADTSICVDDEITKREELLALLKSDAKWIVEEYKKEGV